MVFEKNYSRDTTLFMQELFARGLAVGLQERLGWDNPYLPYCAHFVNNGVVEIWEHKKAFEWFFDKLLKENKKGPKFLTKLLKDYEEVVVQLKKINRKKYISKKQDFAVYTELVSEAIFSMALFFYTGVDERSPGKAKKVSVKVRKMYDLFTENDAFVRRSVAKIKNITEDLAGVVLAEEVFKDVRPQVLKKRAKEFLLLDGKNSFLGSLEAFSKKYPKYVFQKSKVATNANSIQGQIAFKGLVRGTVKIVKRQSDIQKVRRGDILVSPMTTPDFFPAMKKSAAFVTDEGGITCHAAIVAREMKKPCIIGTKFATEILKDGDRVEVDANKGIVKILK